jgi:hypothetical protein
MMDNLHKHGFDLCDSIPCFLDIVPGITPLEEALTIIGLKGVIGNLGGKYSRYFSIEKIYGRILIVPGDPHIAGFEISPYEVQITFGEFAELYGPPCVVYVEPIKPPSNYSVKFMCEYPLIRLMCQDIVDDDLSISEATITDDT